MSYTREEWRIKFDALPENLREYLISENYTNSLIELGKKNNLQIDEVGIMGETVQEVFFGDLSSTEFQKELERNLQTTPEKAAGLTKELNEAIFLPMREELKRISKEKSPDELHPLPANKQEAREHVLGAIEEPEKVPMKVTILETPVPQPQQTLTLSGAGDLGVTRDTTGFMPPPAPITQPKPTPPATTEAPTTLPNIRRILPTAPTPPQQEPAAPTLTPATPPPTITQGTPLKPAPAPRAPNTPDPYRELAK